MDTTSITGPLFNQTPVCEAILRALPDWFGMEEGIQQYLQTIGQLPTFLACQSKRALGFLTVKVHNPYAAELYVMGILPEAHRQGLGRRLVTAAEAFLRAQGIEYFQVKTLGPSHPDSNYEKTRAFYLATGFRPIEEFPLLWDENNPCLIMVKKISG